MLKKNLFRIVLISMVFIGLTLSLIGITTTVNAEEPEYKMVLAHPDPTGSLIDIGAVKFAELVEEKTDGNVEVVVFPNGQLGAIGEIIESVRMGSIQVVFQPPGRLEVYTELASLFKVPYLFESREQAAAVARSEVGEELFDAIAEKSDIRMIGFAWRGFRNIMSKKPVRTVEDMKGLRIRVPPYDLPLKTFETIGAKPTQVEWNELYLALETGLVDAMEGSINTCYPMQFQEVTNYISHIKYIGDVASFLVSQEYLNRLPEEYRNAVREAALEACDVVSESAGEMEENYWAKCEEQGIERIFPDVNEFKEILEDVYYPEQEKWVQIIRSVKVQ